MGRPNTHTHAIAAIICERMGQGQSLREICRDENMPPPSTVRNWVLDDREGFAAQYARARELQAEALVDEIIEISDDGTNDWMDRKSESEKGAGILSGQVLDQEHMQRSKLRVDTRKWFASKVLPKKYGEKMHHAGDEDNPVVHKHEVSLPPLMTREEWLATHKK